MKQKNSIYDFKIPALTGGKTIDFEDFRGKKLLIVNTASECGYTPQYAQLQELYTHFEGKLAIVGCPSNDFGGQEPKEASDIVAFCEKNYGVSFTLTEKLKIKGDDKHELYEFLQEKSQIAVKWNFQKYFFDENGQLLKVLPSAAEPLSEEMFLLVDIEL